MSKLKIRVHESVQVSDVDPDKVVKDIFDENEFYYDWSWDFDTGNLTVDVPFGDWKHDHGHLNYVMKENGFTCIGENHYGEKTDDDSYSAVHIFKAPAVIKKVVQC